MVNKQKPADHYHQSHAVIRYLTEHGFALVTRQFRPRYGIPIPLFEIAVLRRTPDPDSSPA